LRAIVRFAQANSESLDQAASASALSPDLTPPLDQRTIDSDPLRFTRVITSLILPASVVAGFFLR